jgi:predicted acylesterase/phospholipase RssA
LHRCYLNLSIRTTPSKKRKQRALVMQGGGALGAYEAGVYRVLYEQISESLETQNRVNENIFDIIAGTSIGAINAAIIVSQVVKNKKENPSWNQLECWKDSADKLEEFWTDQIASEPELWRTNYNDYYSMWNDEVEYSRGRSPQIATFEAARRYYSAKAFLIAGARNVFRPREGQFPAYDEKFFDDSRLDDINNLWFRYSNYPLKQSIKKYVSEKLKTNSPKEPRLLMCSVDVEEGETVVFDSYSEKSEYAYDKVKKRYEHTLNYKDGLMVEHILASASIPLLFDYQWVPKEYNYQKYALGEEQDEDDPAHKNFRPFWDGGLLSNTPIRELINEHKIFWEKNTSLRNGKSIFEMRKEAADDERKREQYGKELFNLFWEEMVTKARAAARTRTRHSGREGPQQPANELKADDLDIFIVNLWPTKETPLPLNDYDLTKDRMFDIINYDKTGYDLKVATFVTDYIELARDLVQQLAKDAISGDGQEKVKREAAREILLNDSKTVSKFREGTPRTYLDLLIGRFDIKEPFKIERREDNKNTVSNKWTDLSHKTIEELIKQGKKDASKKIDENPITL